MFTIGSKCFLDQSCEILQGVRIIWKPKNYQILTSDWWNVSWWNTWIDHCLNISCQRPWNSPEWSGLVCCSHRGHWSWCPWCGRSCSRCCWTEPCRWPGCSRSYGGRSQTLRRAWWDSWSSGSISCDPACLRESLEDGQRSYQEWYPHQILQEAWQCPLLKLTNWLPQWPNHQKLAPFVSPIWSYELPSTSCQKHQMMSPGYWYCVKDSLITTSFISTLNPSSNNITESIPVPQAMSWTVLTFLCFNKWVKNCL